jgi:hypothetical protein
MSLLLFSSHNYSFVSYSVVAKIKYPKEPTSPKTKNELTEALYSTLSIISNFQDPVLFLSVF